MQPAHLHNSPSLIELSLPSATDKQQLHSNLVISSIISVKIKQLRMLRLNISSMICLQLNFTIMSLLYYSTFQCDIITLGTDRLRFFADYRLIGSHFADSDTE